MPILREVGRGAIGLGISASEQFRMFHDGNRPVGVASWALADDLGAKRIDANDPRLAAWKGRRTGSLRSTGLLKPLLKFAGLLLWLLSAAPFVAAQAQSDAARPADVLWSVPSIRMLDLMRSSDGTIFILTQNEKKEKSLLVGANESGPGRKIPIANSSAMPEADVRLVEGQGDTLWIGGTRNTRAATFGGLVSDGYLGKIDREGRLSWELDFARRNRKIELQSIASLPSGDVVVAGKEDDRSWLARVSKDGRLSWEKTFGLGAIASVAVMGDVVLVAAFEASGEPVPGRDPARVTLWRFSDTGEMLGHQTIGDAALAHGPSSSWVMKVVVATKAIYVFSAWTDLLASPTTATTPLSIVKMDMTGHVLWQKEIADTSLQTRIGSLICVRAVVILADGSALADCSAGGIKLFRLAPNTGEVTRSFLPDTQRPNCDGIFGWSRFVVQRSENAAWVFGYGRGCSWLQQVSLTDFVK